MEHRIGVRSVCLGGKKTNGEELSVRMENFLFASNRLQAGVWHMNGKLSVRRSIENNVCVRDRFFLLPVV